MNLMSRVDQIYRSAVFSKFFPNGWGCPYGFEKLFDIKDTICNREKCLALVDANHKVSIDTIEFEPGAIIMNGHTQSPLVKHLPGLLPKVAETAFFQFIVPVKWTGPDKPLCIHMAGTGDHHFWRRRNFIARPLLREYGIASLLVENPFYGDRKPKEQHRSNLLNVSDIFVMGGSLVLESVAILRWCEREGYGPFCMHGISMGGHMASLSATNWPKPIGLVPCLSWSTASGVFTKGVLSSSIDWHCLEDQLEKNPVYRKEIAKLMDLKFDSEEYDEPKPVAVTKDITKLSKRQNPVVRFMTKYFWIGIHKVSTVCYNVFPKSRESMISVGLHTMQQHSEELSKGNNSETFKERYERQKRINKRVKRDAVRFMRHVMDECTHVKNFSVPVDPELIIVVAAEYDGYVPRDDPMPLDKVWPGCEVRYIKAGHISAYLLHQSTFRKAIADSINRHRERYYADGTPRNPNKNGGSKNGDNSKNGDTKNGNGVKNGKDMKNGNNPKDGDSPSSSGPSDGPSRN